jgi:hypothetical protein
MNGRQHAWALLTGKGRKAFKAHVTELERIVALASSMPAASGS